MAYRLYIIAMTLPDPFLSPFLPYPTCWEGGGVEYNVCLGAGTKNSYELFV